MIPPNDMPDDRELREDAREYWRNSLAGGVLNDLCDAIREDAHEGSCWDIVNELVDILVPLTMARDAAIRIDEHQTPVSFVVAADSSKDYEQGFDDAIKQFVGYRDRRIAELSATQAKEEE